MHAGSHDSHVAMLLRPAKSHHNRRHELKGTYSSLERRVMLVLTICYLDDINGIFFIHVFPSYPNGVIASRPDTMLPSVGLFSDTIRGKGSHAHAATPHHNKDPILAAAFAILALEQIVIELQAAVHRCEAEVEFMEKTHLPYPVVVNDEALHEDSKKNESLKSDKALHSPPFFLVDEEAFPVGAALNAAVAIALLGQTCC
ncbi:Peptidase M20, dimerization domain containing protein [Trema orientale]|uniref:Peptidase M20, dimerization domain containing protein n=1 Tax=Trema orientale TaxID=63057 RepID=A0A2P5EBI1_TREOI|nr:Peptidase M20, dimerization domain containing protein [Trema orientale]